MKWLKSFDFQKWFMKRHCNNMRKVIPVPVLKLSSYEKFLWLNSFRRSSPKAVGTHAIEINLPNNTKIKTLNTFT